MNKTELKIFIAMSKVINTLSRKTNTIVTKHDLTCLQFAVLEVLYHKGALPVGEIQEKVLSTSGTIAVVVKNLEKNGFIFRSQDLEDKRKSVINLTPKGFTTIEKVYPKNEKMIISIMIALSKEEQETMLKYLKKITGYENEKDS